MRTRTFLLTTALLFTGYTINAQFTKGTKMVGASIGTIVYTNSSGNIGFPGGSTIGYTSNSNSFNVDIAPSFGWFINEKTAVGFTFLGNPRSEKITFESQGKTFQQDKASSFNIGAGVFARTYFSKGSSFMPFGQVSLDAGISTQKKSGFFYGNALTPFKETYDGKSSGGFFSNASAVLGMTKLLNPNIGLDIFLGYKFSYSKVTLKTTTLRDENNDGSIDISSTNNYTTKLTNNGISIGVGLQIFLKNVKSKM